MSKFTESIVEEACLEYFKALDYQYFPGPEIASDGLFAERSGYGDVLLRRRLRDALVKINPTIPATAIDDAVKQVAKTDSPTAIINNRAFHKLVTEGVDVQFRRDGRVVTDKVWLFDWDNLKNNDWLVVNQFTVHENHVNRRPDIVVFINGIPIATIELKNPADENATVRSAYNQLQTYKAQIPSLFTYNELLIISDGHEAKLGGLTSDWERFTPWRTIDGENIVPPECPQMETLIKGVFQKHIILDLIRHFIVFEEDAGKITKIVSAYHQYHAVNKAVITLNISRIMSFGSMESFLYSQSESPLPRPVTLGTFEEGVEEPNGPSEGSDSGALPSLAGVLPQDDQSAVAFPGNCGRHSILIGYCRAIS